MIDGMLNIKNETTNLYKQSTNAIIFSITKLADISLRFLNLCTK